MPEIWLNYGKTEVVLDIKAENLEQKIDVEGKTLSDSEIESKLDALGVKLDGFEERLIKVEKKSGGRF